jgi:competence protein ComEC
VRRLDGIVATHFQLDHVGNVEAAAAHLHPRWVARPRTGPGPWQQLALSGARLQAVCAGSRLHLGPARLRVVHPPCDHAVHRSADQFNDNAVVLVVEVGRERVLLPADAESDVAGSLDVGHVDLLKVAHHGSADPGLAPWLARLSPRVAAISVGARNDYGHPVPATLDTLRASGADVHRTDREGTLTWQLDGRHLRQLTQ